MFQLGIIVLARIIHVMAGIAWAGGTFVLAGVIVPMAARYGNDGFGRWAPLIAKRVGPMLGIAGLLTVLSGAYLFYALHAADTSTGGLVLRAGALAALLAFATGLVSRATGRKLAQLTVAGGGAPGQSRPTPPEVVAELATLQRRALLSTRVTAGLLGLAVLSMAMFRYVQAL